MFRNRWPSGPLPGWGTRVSGVKPALPVGLAKQVEVHAGYCPEHGPDFRGLTAQQASGAGSCQSQVTATCLGLLTSGLSF